MYDDVVATDTSGILNMLKQAEGSVLSTVCPSPSGTPQPTSIPVGSTGGIGNILKNIPPWVWWAVGGYILVKKIL